MADRSLKERFNTRTVKEIISIDTLNFNNEIYLGEYGDFLKQKSYELTLINAKGALALGKIFEEVYQKLGKETGEGIYLEWLKSNNFNTVNIIIMVSKISGKQNLNMSSQFPYQLNSLSK